MLKLYISLIYFYLNILIIKNKLNIVISLKLIIIFIICYFNFWYILKYFISNIKLHILLLYLFLIIIY